MFAPRYYQSDASDAYFTECVEKGKRGLIVIPTGGGKSVVQADIIRRIGEYEKPNGKKPRVLCLTHQKTLIDQNYKKYISLVGDNADAGIYSAGLKSRDTENQVLFAGIQSVHNKAYHLGFIDAIIIDEVHRVPVKNMGTYRKFLDDMFKINRNIVLAGMSATPYRLGEGVICDESLESRIFDEIIYECTIPELIDPTHKKNRDGKQYLSKLISKGAVNPVDLSGVHIVRGDYKESEMQEAYLADGLVSKAVEEILRYTADRKHVIIFTTGITHAEQVYENLIKRGQTAAIGHSVQGSDRNDESLSLFTNNEVKYLVNVDMWTTGFDYPGIDCVVLLRSTLSAGLYYQMCGRGLRMAIGKGDCLVLDFGHNIETHGPIDKIEIRKKKKSKKKMEVITAKVKKCPSCNLYIAVQATVCPECGYEFPDIPNHDETASEADILSKWKKPTEYEIFDLKLSVHWKEGTSVPILRADYYVNQYRYFSQWICIEHQGYAKQKAISWLKKRTEENILTVDEAVEKQDTFRKPKTITIDFNGKYPEIKGEKFPE